MRAPSEPAAYAALTLSAVVWGGSIVGQKWALGSFSAVETSVLRGLGALAILVPLWWWQEGKSGKLSGGDLGLFVALGLGVLGNHILTLFGLRYVNAAVAGVVIGASPAITAVLSSLLIRDVPFGSVWLGCTVSFAGVAFVSGSGPDSHVGDHPWLGGTLVVLGLVSWALYTIGSRRTMERFSPLFVNWTTLLISLLFQIPLLWTDQKLAQTGLGSVPASGWLALVYLIVFATALGQQAWLYGVQGVGPSRAGVFVNLIPVSALGLSAAVLGDPIGAREVVGIGLILTGVWLVNRQSAHSLRERERGSSLEEEHAP
jgi:drug/metabolite transporter (DMT)-like permease